MSKQRRLTAVCAVRISAEADQLRAQLQDITGLPANRLVERAFEALRDKLGQPKAAQREAAS